MKTITIPEKYNEFTKILPTLTINIIHIGKYPKGYYKGMYYAELEVIQGGVRHDKIFLINGDTLEVNRKLELEIREKTQKVGWVKKIKRVLFK